MVTYHLKHTGPLTNPKSLSRLDVVVPGELTVRGLLVHLLGRGDVIGRRQDYATDPDRQLLILVNGVPLRELGGPDTLLKDQDTVAILVPVLGG